MQITQREEPDVEIKLTPEEVRSAISCEEGGQIWTGRIFPNVGFIAIMWEKAELESFLTDEIVAFEVAAEVLRKNQFGVCGTGGPFTVYLATNPDALASLMGRKSH